MRKYREFDLPGHEQAFNLAGEKLIEPEPKQAAIPDSTMDLFNQEPKEENGNTN